MALKSRERTDWSSGGGGGAGRDGGSPGGAGGLALAKSLGLRLLFILVPLAVFGLLKPEVVKASFSSGQTLLRVLALVAGWLVFSWVVGRFVPNPALRVVALAVPGLALAWVIVLPYFRDVMVDEPVPVTAAAPAPTSTAPPPTTAPPTTRTAAPAATPTTRPPATVPAPRDSPRPTPAPAGPDALLTGQFKGLAGHRGAGTANVLRLDDGSHVVRLESLNVSNGPGPQLFLVPGAGRTSPEGGTFLGDLKGNMGNQNYPVPAGTDVTGPMTVLIWCDPFVVPIAGATVS